MNKNLWRLIDMGSRASPACHAWLLWDANGSGDPVIWGFEMKGKPGHALPTGRVFNTFARDAEFQHGLQETSRTVAFSSLYSRTDVKHYHPITSFLPENRTSASFLTHLHTRQTVPVIDQSLCTRWSLFYLLGVGAQELGPAARKTSTKTSCSVPASASAFSSRSGYIIVAITQHWASVLEIY